MKNSKTIAHYLDLPYTIVLKRDDEGDFVGRIEELQGCVAHGKNEGEAIQNLKKMQELWIKDCIDAREPVPPPKEDDILPSGKWVQRVPRSLHKKLVEQASREEVSLNQLVSTMLAEAVGGRAMQKYVDASLIAHYATRHETAKVEHIDAMWRGDPGQWRIAGTAVPARGVSRQIAGISHMFTTFLDDYDNQKESFHPQIAAPVR
jgi:antitoxin HicB